MKTQLLEDIGENATLSLTPSNIAGNSTPGQAVQVLAPAGKTQPARPRSALGVWRQKPAEEPPVSITQEPERQPTPEELDKVLEEIAALEAQYVPPAQQPEPAIVPVEPRHVLPVRPVAPELTLPTAPAEPQQKLPTAPAEPQQKLPTSPVESQQKRSTPPVERPPQPAIRPAEPALAASPTQAAAAPQVPVFDFTPPSPERQEADPFTPASTGGTRSGQRYLLWGACVLSGALLVLGGRWFYQERSDAGSLALIAGEAKGELKADNALMRPAVAAKEPPAEPARPPVSSLPPMVMLEPDPPAPASVEQPAPSAADREAPQVETGPEPVAAQKSAAPAPKSSSRIARERSEAAAERAAERRKREPVRQIARTSAPRTEKPAAEESNMEATLRACRAHGYHAAQCIKRDCSVTKHGFVCRGR